jgi:hypothetical protein
MVRINKYYKWIESNNNFWYDKRKKIWTFNPTPPFSTVCHVKTLRAARRRIRKWKLANPGARFTVVNKYPIFHNIII